MDSILKKKRNFRMKPNWNQTEFKSEAKFRNKNKLEVNSNLKTIQNLIIGTNFKSISKLKLNLKMNPKLKRKFN